MLSSTQMSNKLATSTSRLLKLVAIEVVNIMISRLVYIGFLLETLLELLKFHGKVEIVPFLQGSKLFL